MIWSRKALSKVLLAVAVMTFVGCGGGNGSGGLATSAINLGAPIDGLDAATMASFERGKLIFDKDFRPSEGLGPMYNASSCRACHSTPVGGGSAPRYRNFYLAAAGPTEVLQSPLPGLPSIVVPSFGQGPHVISTFGLEGGRTVIPEQVIIFPVVTAQRNSIPAFGVGRFETISDATIMAMSDPDDADGDGISGRFNRDSAGIGRFGAKSQSNNIELFTRAPLQNQMGITTNPFQGSAGTISLHARGAFLQASSSPNDPTTDNDGVPDPEMSHQDLGDLITYTRLLAPPEKQAFGPDEIAGEVLFEQVGCAKCHVPSIMGSEGPVEAYTDLLIHEMGSELADGIHQGMPQLSAIDPSDTASEFRTAPLWGVSLHAPYLHDGRADTLEEAILLHGGEAASVIAAYQALSLFDRAMIIRFLEAL